MSDTNGNGNGNGNGGTVHANGTAHALDFSTVGAQNSTVGRMRKLLAHHEEHAKSHAEKAHALRVALDLLGADQGGEKVSAPSGAERVIAQAIKLDADRRGKRKKKRGPYRQRATASDTTPPPPPSTDAQPGLFVSKIQQQRQATLDSLNRMRTGGPTPTRELGRQVGVLSRYGYITEAKGGGWLRTSKEFTLSK